MKEKSYSSLEEAWEQITQEPTVWSYLELKDQSFYYSKGVKSIFLSSFKSKELPDPPYTLKFFGKILTKLSHFANIMSRRPGTEEVTFYALLNSPQNGILGRKTDQKMLDIAAPPLVWRREQIRESIKQKIKVYVKEKKTFMFLDIGCGGGFDSLEIERLLHGISELTGDKREAQSYGSLNIDIDSKWLNNNQILTEELFGNRHNIMRENISVFEFFSKNAYQLTLNQYDNLIISCNGFAEFFSDTDLQKLYNGIYEITESFEGGIHVILPFATKNKKQEAIGEKIGFRFQAQEKNEIVSMIEKTFETYQVSYTEKYSQIVMIIEK